MSQRFSLAAGVTPHGQLDVTHRSRICKLLRSPGIDSKESTLPAYVAWRRASTSNRVVVPARQAGNRFLGSSKGLQIRLWNRLGYWRTECYVVFVWWTILFLYGSEEFRDGILGHKSNKRLQSSLKKIILFPSFKNPLKKNPRYKNTRVYSWIAFCWTENEGRKPDENSSLRRQVYVHKTSIKLPFEEFHL